MTKSVLRRLTLPALVLGLLAGLYATSASTASAQIIGSTDPCGGTGSFAFNTSGQPQADFDGQRGPGSCLENQGWYSTYQVFNFTLAGTGPHSVSAETCGTGSADTELRIYQKPGGAANAFTPGTLGNSSTCLNLKAWDDDTCAPLSKTSASGLVNGAYAVVVNNWFGQSQAISGILKVSAPTCRPAGYGWFDKADWNVADPLKVCTTGRGTILITVTNTGVSALNNTIADEFFVDVIGVGGPVQVVSIASGTGGGGAIPASLPSPNCALEGGASVDLVLAPGESDTITINIAFPQGIGAVSAIQVNRSVFVDFNNNNGCGTGDAVFHFADTDPVALPCAPTVAPNTQLGKQVHLPILNFQGQDDVCESWIEVQNLGCRNAKAALVTWGEPGFCPPQAAGPLKVECTGLLKPGSTWNLQGAQVPTGSKSGILFKLSARQLSQDGIDVGFDDITGDYVCELLFFGVVGDADDYRRFKKAYNEGLDFQGVDMEKASGEGLLAVDVHRSCPGDATPGVDVTSKYNGLAGSHLGTYDDVYGGYSYYVPLIYASAAGFNTIMYIQNGGLLCSSVEIWFKARDDCLRATICDIATLAPGETYQLDANDCVGPDFQGSAWIRSTQVLGIAVDIIGGDVLMTYVGEPGEINYTFDPNKSTTKDGNQVAFGPLIYSEYQGWDTGIQVQNLSPVFAAKVKVYFLDRSGDIITTLVDWVCPRGSQTFFLPVVFDLPGNWVGSIRAESQEWVTPGGPNVLAPNIVGVATLIKYNDVARTQKTEAIAYNLLPEHKIYDWQLGYGAGGLDSGIGLIAIPSVLRDLQNSGLTTEIAIANVVPKPGFTDLVIYFYDQNGLLDYVCQKLNEKQVEYIDLQTWGYINDGFKGSAVISAWFWEHDVFDDRGFFLRNLVGLGAVSIERKGTHGGEDVPGDEAAGDRGIPFAQTYDDKGKPVFEFCFMGPIPLCPGFADLRPQPGDCADSGTFDVDFTFTSTSSQLGGQLDYILIPGTQDTASGGACGPAIPGVAPSHNWDATDLIACNTGTAQVTANAITLTPFTGQSCAGGQGQVQGLWYPFTRDNIERTSGDSCVGLLQDAMVQNSGGTQAFNPGDTKPFPVYTAGTHSFAAMNWCDVTGASSNTGSASFTIDTP